MKKTCISRDWYVKSFADESYRRVDLPHDYVLEAGRSPDTPAGARIGFYRSGAAKYVKYLTLDKTKQHYILDLDGAYMCARIYVNEEFMGLHPYGYTPYLVNITDNVIAGGINKIAVLTDTLHPSSRWYTGGGLYRDVFLWTGGKVRIEPWNCFITTPTATDERAEVNVQYGVTSDISATATIKATVLDASGHAVAGGETSLKVRKSRPVPCNLCLTVDTPSLWCPEHPYLYTLHTEVIVKGELTDESDESFGIRTVTFDVENGCLLNGKPIKLRGGCIHHDHGALGAASFPAAEARKVRNLKAAGFNAIRISHYPPSLALLEACDREGMLVMDEAFDMWNVKKTDHDYHLWFADWHERDLAAMVCRDRNHPCVISYSIGNEINERDGSSSGAAWSRRLADIIRHYDDTRPVTAGISMVARINKYEAQIDSEEYLAQPLIRDRSCTPKNPDSYEDWAKYTEGYMAPLDIVGYNYLYKYYERDHERFPERVIWGSETHTLNFYDDWTLTASLPYVLGNFTWTAHDNLGEAGTGRMQWAREGYMPGFSRGPYPWRTCHQGDLDLCGYRRPQSYFREAIWLGGTEPRIFTTHPEHHGESFSGTGWHFYDVHETWTFSDDYLGRPVECSVYTDADEIVFTLNGREVGKASPVKGIASLDIPYERGSLTADAYKDGTLVGTHTLETTTAPACITLTPEQASIKADRRDLAYVQVAVTDEHGRHVPEYRGELTCTVTGGELMGFFSADPCNEDVYGSNKCHAFEGRALAVIRTATAGNITLTVTADSLESGTATVRAI